MAVFFKKIKKFFEPCDIRFVFFAVLFWRFIVFLIAVGGYFLLPERYAPLSFLNPFWKGNFLFWSWANFDGEHYLKIAQSSYGYNRELPLFSFFPVYPLLVRFFSFLFKGDIFLAGQAIIFIFLPLTVYFANKFLKEKGFSCEQILLADALFLFSPGAVFLNAFYTELPFLLFAILSLYFLNQGKYGWASFWAALASGTRVVGIFLSLAIFWRFLNDKKTTWFKKVFFPFIASLGLLFYSLYLGFKFGNPLLFGLSHRAWGKAQIVSPLVTLIKYGRTILFPPQTLSWLNYYVVVLEFLIVIGALFSFAFLWIKEGKEKNISPLLIFSTFCFVLPLLTGSFGTMPRYLLTFLSLFPFWAGQFMKIKQRRVRSFIFLLIFFIFSSGVILFTRGYWWG